MTVLRLFADSIFIQTQLSIREGDLLPDQLGMGAPLLPGQRERLRAASKLLLVVDVAGWINDHSLSLQAAVMSYTLLVPMMQLGVVAKPLLKVREGGVLYQVWIGLLVSEDCFFLRGRLDFCRIFILSKKE